MVAYGISVTVLCLSLVALLSWVLSSFNAERDKWALERSNLLDRVQAPERAVIRQTERQAVQHVVPEDEGEMAKVGMIVWGEADE